MATLTKQLQKIVDAYIDDGQSWPASTHQIAAWAILKKLWLPQPSAMIDQCANQLARAMREEHIIDPQGRTVRAKHVVRGKNQNGEQTAFWDDIRTISEQNMQISSQQRRLQIVGDCRQQKIDVDSINENRRPEKDIKIIYDFTLDVEETDPASNF